MKTGRRKWGFVPILSGENKEIYANQLMINFYGVKGLKGYNGDNQDSILLHGYTLKDNGIRGLPVCFVSIVDQNGYEYNGNALMTGEDARIFKSWNGIEPERGKTLVQPGQKSFIPKNCEFEISAPSSKEDGKLDRIPLYRFKLEDGVPTLIWENKDVEIIGQR